MSTISTVDGSAPAAIAFCVASRRALSRARSRGSSASEKTLSVSPPTWAIAAPMAFATEK